MARRWLAAAAFLCLCAVCVRAQAAGREVKAVAGKEVRVAIYTNIRPDCTSGPLPTIRLAVAPKHGAVKVKRGTLKATNFKQCLAAEVPVFVAFYRAADGFSGADEFALEIVWTGGRKELQVYRVSIAGERGAGQGI